MTDSTLAGIRVVSIAINLPGPLAAARLRQLGAEVIKVEPPTGDPLALLLPHWYAELAADQKVIQLDLKDSDDKAALEAELAQSDIFITSHRPSALRRLGLLDAHLRHSRLSHIEIVGHDGDLAETPGHDLTYQAAYGTIVPPTMPTGPVVDMLGSERAVSAALGCLLDRGRTGAGQHHRVVLEDAAAFAGAAVRHGMMGTGAPLGGADPAYRIYATADGHVALAALEPHFRQRLLDLLEIPETHLDLEAVFANRTNEQWRTFGHNNDIPLAPINSGGEH